MRLRNILTGASALALLASAAHAERGSDGEVKVLYDQAISIMTPYLSSGTKDIDGAALVLEPLARYDDKGHLVPFIASEIPTLENGGIARDLKSITWKIRPDILWSDGSPVTAADAIFTWKYCTAPDGGCAQAPYYDDVANVEAVDDKTVKVSFTVPKPYPYTAFVGAQSPVIQARQFANCLGAAAPSCTEANTKPIGTGPFRVTDFKPNDVVTLEANPHYRDPAKPAFATMVLKGGGDAASAARSVLETGEFDYAWNAQVEPEILAQMAQAGKGEIISAFGTLLERIHVNQTNPSPALGAERSTMKHPHPWLTDPRVTRALSLAIDREILVETGYGEAGRPTCNLVPAPEYQNSPNNGWCLKQDLDQANRLLDEAGWTRGPDGVRVKDGKRFSILYQTSVNSVRQATQALVKQWWNEIGVEVELRQIDPAVFFGGDPGSPDTLQKFFADVEMYADNFEGTDAERYLGQWVCGEIPGPENAWQGGNTSRFCEEEYDKLRAEMATTVGEEARAAVTIKLNDMIVNSASVIPLIHRGRVSTRSKTLGGVALNPFDSELWNVADWYRVK